MIARFLLCRLLGLHKWGHFNQVGEERAGGYLSVIYEYRCQRCSTVLIPAPIYDTWYVGT